jgi:hypothetical protein
MSPFILGTIYGYYLSKSSVISNTLHILKHQLNSRMKIKKEHKKKNENKSQGGVLPNNYFHICHFFSQQVKRLNEISNAGNAKPVKIV